MQIDGHIIHMLNPTFFNRRINYLFGFFPELPLKSHKLFLFLFYFFAYFFVRWPLQI